MVQGAPAKPISVASRQAAPSARRATVSVDRPEPFRQPVGVQPIDLAGSRHGIELRPLARLEPDPSWPRASGITRMSENTIAASRPVAPHGLQCRFDRELRRVAETRGTRKLVGGAPGTRVGDARPGASARSAAPRSLGRRGQLAGLVGRRHGETALRGSVRLFHRIYFKNQNQVVVFDGRPNSEDYCLRLAFSPGRARVGGKRASSTRNDRE